jgi:hypothetical protein
MRSSCFVSGDTVRNIKLDEISDLAVNDKSGVQVARVVEPVSS